MTSTQPICNVPKTIKRLKAYTINRLLLTMLIAQFMVACNSTDQKLSENEVILSSPDSANTIEFVITPQNKPAYIIKHKNRVLVDTSELGIDFKNQELYKKGFKIIDSERLEIDEKWEMPWGEKKDVTNRCNELSIQLEEIENPQNQLTIILRAYNDGVAFRYSIPEIDGIDSLIIMNENTEFQLTEDYDSWWSPGDWDSYEHPFFSTKVSKIDALKLKENGLAQSQIKANAVNTPFTMRTKDNIHMSIHEANLTNYAGMTLKLQDDLLLKSDLVGSDRYGYKAKVTLPFKTPWRTITIAEEAKDLLISDLIVNLNEPSVIEDVSWFEPKKYVGIWWEMHLNKSSWAFKSDNHGATTENAKKYIDFAAENGFKGVLVEGWNTGWEHWIGFDDREGVFDFITPYPDYDLNEVVAYAKDKGVEIIMHHETSAAPRTYEQQIDTAYKLMESLGIHSVKTGYVGPIIPKGEYHHGQWMVNHYRRVLQKAAEHKIAINAHEPIKPTGIRRTYPNAISREGARGQEFNAWASDGGNKPEHTAILAYTRMLAGPMDFTPGVFDITLPGKPNNQINTTLAHQLALFVVLYSPVQMACDLPENYVDQPGFQFIRDVGVDWQKTVAIGGEVGDYIVIARQERKTKNWFVGGASDEESREVKVDFNFLEEGKKYSAILYKDSNDAHYKNNPKGLEIERFNVDRNTTKSIKMVPGGGFAISIMQEE